jgi:hypothetical protein
MWCSQCQADVAGELSLGGLRLKCAICGQELAIDGRTPSEDLQPAPSSAAEQNARELLARWSTESAIEPSIRPYQLLQHPVPADVNSAEPVLESQVSGDPKSSFFVPLDIEASENELVRPSPEIENKQARNEIENEAAAIPLRPAPKFRIDGASGKAGPGSKLPPESLIQASRTASSQSSEDATVDRKKVPPARRDSRLRLDIDEPRRNKAPHFDVAALERPAPATGTKPKESRSNWATFLGQLSAYGGILLLGGGTSLVVWTYFGGPAHYGPTGWLATTAGQMLLFLGVVTLIAGGMDQTTDEVSRRIETINDHLIRIEQAQTETWLRGPHTRHRVRKRRHSPSDHH